MLEGKFADGQDSSIIAARLRRENDRLVVVDPDGRILTQSPMAAVVVSSRLGNTPRTLAFSEAVFETDDNDAVDRLFAGSNRVGALLHRLESHLVSVAIAAVMTLGCIYWAVTAGIPAAASHIAFALPAEVVNQIGASSLDLLDELQLEPTELSELELAHVRAVLAPHFLGREHSLHFRKWWPNALALPNGSIVFTDGLVDLIESDEELIAVAYHELGHVENRHFLRSSIQASTIGIALFLITGDVTNMDLLVTVPALLANFAYSREAELEADRYAMDAMFANGIDIAHLKNILLKLERYAGAFDDTDETDDSDNTTGVDESLFSKTSRYLSTHPSTAERMELIDAYMAAQNQ